MNVTIVHELDPALIEQFYPLYVAAFEPLRTRAAARHVLSAEEFEAEMLDKRIEKFVVFDDEGEPVAMSTLATDLSAVAWASPEFFAAKYPEHFARDAVFYLGYTLVVPGRRRQGTFMLMMQHVVRRLVQAGAVCAFDFCGHNESAGVKRAIELMCRAGNADVTPVDTQTYYAADFGAHPQG